MKFAEGTFAGDAFAIDSFLLQRRGAFSASQLNWRSFCDERFLTGLTFRWERAQDGGGWLRFTYASNGAELDYLVAFERTDCFEGVKFWFLCPRPGNQGLCQRRSRFLYLPEGQSRFGCRRCLGKRVRLTIRCPQMSYVVPSNR